MSSDREEVFTVCVAGDPIYDVYQMGTLYSKQWTNRFVRSSTQTREGGAANVANNVETLVKDSKVHARVLRMFEPNVAYWPALTRYIVSGDHSIMEYITSEAMLESTYLPPTHIDTLYWIPSGRNGLVISDYNKGATNRPLSAEHLKLLNTKHKFEFIVVDSRYGTFWPGWLDYARMKILHATGAEIDSHDTSLYNYTFHTDGHNPIKLLAWGKHISTYEIPTVDFTDPTGAGDTFTACIAAYLATHCNEAWSVDLMKGAVEWAVPLCQQVVKYLGVGVPVLPTTEETSTEE